MLHVFRNFTEHPMDHEQFESPPGDRRSQPMTKLPISMSMRETLRSESHILESVGDSSPHICTINVRLRSLFFLTCEDRFFSVMPPSPDR